MTPLVMGSQRAESTFGSSRRSTFQAGRSWLRADSWLGIDLDRKQPDTRSDAFHRYRRVG